MLRPEFVLNFVEVSGWAGGAAIHRQSSKLPTAKGDDQRFLKKQERNGKEINIFGRKRMWVVDNKRE